MLFVCCEYFLIPNLYPNTYRTVFSDYFQVRIIQILRSNIQIGKMSGLAGAEALKMAQAVWKTMVQGKGYERILNQVVITSAGQGSCVAEFTIEEGMTNRGGTLHGGCTATLIDCISTIGLMTGKSQSPGVSVNLSVSYLKGAPTGEVIVIDSKTVKSGKNLAFLETVLKNKKNGEIIATGNHLKFIGG